MSLGTIKLIITGLFLYTTTLFAQEVSGYEKVYYSNPETLEQDEVEFSFKSTVAQFDHCKTGITIENNSNDYILYKSSESSFKYEFGDKHPSLKDVYIAPGDKKSKTLQVNGTEQYLQNSFQLEMGGIYRIPLTGNTLSAPDFKLPASTNSMKEGNFKVTLKKYTASTKEAKAIFEVTYTGNEVAIVNPANLSVTAEAKKTNETVTYANDNKKSKPIILHKGDTKKITAVFHIPGKIVDMQFADMMIVWNDTFVESKEIPVEAPVLDFAMDEALTKEKK